MTGHKHHVCPWYGAYLFDNPLRRLAHDPQQIFGPYVRPGMTVLDVGCGMGYFSIGLARLVGAGGRVHALDIQEQMIRVLEKRARRAGVADCIVTHVIGDDGFDIGVKAGFANAFWMLHEVPDQGRFFSRLADHLEPGGKVLVAEPRGHVSEDDLHRSVAAAAGAGFRETERPAVRLSRAVVLELVDRKARSEQI